MSRCFLALLLALGAPLAAVAAPAPPERLVAAEAVVKPPRGGPRELAAKLVSKPLLTAVARSRAEVLTRLAGGQGPTAWLGARLRASADADGAVTLRLVDCPRRDAVTLLAAVLDAYKADLLQGGRATAQAKEQEALVRFLIVAQQGNGQAPGNVAVRLMGTIEMEADRGPTRAEVDGSVLQPPRIVPTGLPPAEKARAR